MDSPERPVGLSSVGGVTPGAQAVGRTDSGDEIRPESPEAVVHELPALEGAEDEATLRRI